MAATRAAASASSALIFAATVSAPFGPDLWAIAAISAAVGTVGQNCGMMPPLSAETGAKPLFNSWPSWDWQSLILKAAQFCGVIPKKLKMVRGAAAGAAATGAPTAGPAAASAPPGTGGGPSNWAGRIAVWARNVGETRATPNSPAIHVFLGGMGLFS